MGASPSFESLRWATRIRRNPRPTRPWAKLRRAALFHETRQSTSCGDNTAAACAPRGTGRIPFAKRPRRQGSAASMTSPTRIIAYLSPYGAGRALPCSHHYDDLAQLWRRGGIHSHVAEPKISPGAGPPLASSQAAYRRPIEPRLSCSTNLFGVLSQFTE